MAYGMSVDRNRGWCADCGADLDSDSYRGMWPHHCPNPGRILGYAPGSQVLAEFTTGWAAVRVMSVERFGPGAATHVIVKYGPGRTCELLACHVKPQEVT